MKRDKIFVNGMTSFEIPDTAPDFILGKGGLHVNDLINFLNENKDFAINGWLNYTILRSKSTGKRYIELDMYNYDKNRSEGLSEDDKKTIQAMRAQEINARTGEPTNIDQPPF